MQHIIFDLDGTISNPEAGILNGYKYTFPTLNIDTPDDATLRTLIGPPLRKVFEEMYNQHSDTATQAIATYRVYYNQLGGAFENDLYDGMFALIQSLHQQHNTLHIATHKGAMVHEILKHFKIRDYFNQLQHYNEEKNIVTKERMIELILENEKISDLNKAVMVGDRHSDIEAAKYTGIKSIGVTYGFGSVKEIEDANPDFVANNVKELHTILHSL
jgi:phosphoglycolate phosphatase